MRLLLLLSIILISCTDKYRVRLPNGSIVKVYDYYERQYKSGDTVCIKYDKYGWCITNMGVMNDSVDTYGNQYRIGIIK